MWCAGRDAGDGVTSVTGGRMWCAGLDAGEGVTSVAGECVKICCNICSFLAMAIIVGRGGAVSAPLRF